MLARLFGFAYDLRSVIGAGLFVVFVAFNSTTHAQLPHIAQAPADLVVIYKGERLLQLKRHGRVIRSFDIALGAEPKGHKRREGDGRTPEGVYTLDWRNSSSQFYRSMHVSYPREEDQTSATRWGESPGGLIMIHGLPNGRRARDVGHPRNDWTNGCIAVRNEEMDEIWSLVDDGTTIIIFP
ncbi:MAG: L,D-transpeptidase family protein [Geminicoccaceae bacterium]